MRISVWQQFSSNNSARFTIVGMFKSPEMAKSAAETVEDVLKQIEDWHQANPEEAAKIWEDHSLISDVEKKLGEKFGLKWDRPVWWTNNYNMRVEDRVVIIKQNWSADSGAHPIDTLLERLGAAVIVDGDAIEHDDVREIEQVTVSCYAPDKPTADTIAQLWNAKIYPSPEGIFVHIDVEGLSDTLAKIIQTLTEKSCTQITVLVKEIRTLSREINISDRG